MSSVTPTHIRMLYRRLTVYIQHGAFKELHLTQLIPLIKSGTQFRGIIILASNYSCLILRIATKYDYVNENLELTLLNHLCV